MSSSCSGKDDAMPERSVSLVLASSTGGVGTHVRSLARGLTEYGWQVCVCGPRATDELFDFSGVGAEFQPAEINGAASGVLATRTIARAVAGSSIVHAHGLRAGAAAALARARPLVVSWHNAQLPASPLAGWLGRASEQLVARRAAISLAASSDLAAHVHDLGGRDVRFAPVGVSVNPAARTPAHVRTELGLRSGQQLVLTVGRLHPQKALEVLVAAAARWPADEVVVLIAGDGPLEHQLAAQIDATGAPVRLLGRRTDVADLLAAADLVVLPSRWEARSLAAQEALLAGRPLVATSVGGLPPLLGDGAEFVPPDDVDALDAAVRGLLADPTRRAALAARGRIRAAQWPTEADTVNQIRAVYGELLGAG
jgi:glycosyltransferase involved in cell wall biosynthesis